MVDDTIVRVLMTHKILEDGLSPMEALAYVLRECGASNMEAAEVMSKMCKREITNRAATVYAVRARKKLAEKAAMDASGVPQEPSE